MLNFLIVKGCKEFLFNFYFSWKIILISYKDRRIVEFKKKLCSLIRNCFCMVGLVFSNSFFKVVNNLF